jgi:GAF domain-containing protein
MNFKTRILNGQDFVLDPLWLFETLQPVLVSITHCKSIEEIAHAALQGIEKIFDVEHTGFYFLDPNTERFSLVLAKGLTEDERKRAENTAMERHPGWVLKNKSIYVSKDDDQAVHYSERVQIKSRVYCPIVHENQILGTLGIASAKANAFSELHVKLIKFLCDVVAISQANLLSTSRLKKALSRSHRSELRVLPALPCSKELQAQYL